MIDQEDFMGALLHQNVTALAVGIVDQQVEQGHGAQAFQLGRFEIKIMMIGVVINVLLERTGTQRSVPQNGEWNHAEAQRLADQVGADFPVGQGVFREIPQRLFAPARFVDRQDFIPGMADSNQEGVIDAAGELALELDLAIYKDGLERAGLFPHITAGPTGLKPARLQPTPCHMSQL